MLMAPSGSLTRPTLTTVLCLNKRGTESGVSSAFPHLAAGNRAAHTDLRSSDKNGLFAHIMNTNPHCCQGVHAVLSQHFPTQGQGLEDGMRSPFSVRSFQTYFNGLDVKRTFKRQRGGATREDRGCQGNSHSDART